MSTATLPNKLVLVRHGESTWNLENRFTGWVDVGLSPKGVDEAHAAGRLLKSDGFRFDRLRSRRFDDGCRRLYDSVRAGR